MLINMRNRHYAVSPRAWRQLEAPGELLSAAAASNFANMPEIDTRQCDIVHGVMARQL